MDHLPDDTKESHLRFENEHLPCFSTNTSLSLLTSPPSSIPYFHSQLHHLDSKCTPEEFQHVYNKKNFYESKNAKNLCRHGIPLNYMRPFYHKLFHLANSIDSYYNKYAFTFKHHNPYHLGEYVPYYSGTHMTTLNAVLPVHYLNDDGITNMKTILWMINDLIPRIEYCPLIPRIISILLVLLEKEEAYEAIRILLEMNYKPTDMHKLRWHLRFTRTENEKLITTIGTFLSGQDDMKQLFTFFKTLNFDATLLIKNMVECLFLEYLNFNAILRVFPFFLLEGSKSLFRITYGILKLIEHKIYAATTKESVVDVVKKASFQLKEFDELFEIAFQLPLSRFNNNYVRRVSSDTAGEDYEIATDEPLEALPGYVTANYRSDFYLPEVKYNHKEISDIILTPQEVVLLWEQLPPLIKHSDLVLIYSQRIKKTNLKSIYRLCEKYPYETNIIMVIETEKNEVFGAFLSNMLISTNEKFITPSQSFLLKIRPRLEIVDIIDNDSSNDTTCNGVEILKCTEEKIMFGKCENGSCVIEINGNVEVGKFSSETSPFGKVKLFEDSESEGSSSSKGEGLFNIKNFELFALVENAVA